MSFIRLCEGLQDFMSLLLRMNTFEVESHSLADTWGMTTDTAPLPTCNGHVPLRRNIGSWHHRVCMERSFFTAQPTYPDWPVPFPSYTPHPWEANLHVVAFTLTILLGPCKHGDGDFKCFRNLFNSLFSPGSLYVIWIRISYSWAGGREGLSEGTCVWGRCRSSHHVLLKAPGLSPMLVTTFHTSRLCLNVSKQTRLIHASHGSLLPLLLGQ